MRLSSLPSPVAPGNATEMELWPKGLTVLQHAATEVEVDRKGASMHLAGGCDAINKQQCMFHAAMIPTFTEHPRRRKGPTRGRTWSCNAASHA